jgi:hypothetical protein
MKREKPKYEKLFFDKKRIRRWCKKELISAYNNDPETADEYIKQTRKIFRSFYRTSWDHMIKMNWLLRRFTYDGHTRGLHNSEKNNGIALDAAFGTFVRNHVNVDHRLLFNANSIFSKLSTYIDDFYPGFLDMTDVLDSKFSLPYKNLGFEHMVLVYQLENRLELLASAEKKRMPYLRFIDYVIDHCYTKNDNLDSPEFDFILMNASFPYVKSKKYTDKIMARFNRKPKV